MLAEMAEEVTTSCEIEEQEDEVEDKKRHLNVVFIGHVGKLIMQNS